WCAMAALYLYSIYHSLPVPDPDHYGFAGPGRLSKHFIFIVPGPGPDHRSAYGKQKAIPGPYTGFAFLPVPDDRDPVQKLGRFYHLDAAGTMCLCHVRL